MHRFLDITRDHLTFRRSDLEILKAGIIRERNFDMRSSDANDNQVDFGGKVGCRNLTRK